MAITPSERALLGKTAAHSSWAKTEDRSARTSKARAAMDQKFLDQAGGDVARAEQFRKAHYARLALASAVSRRKAKEAREESERAERELAGYEQLARDQDASAVRPRRTDIAERIAQAIEAEARHATPGTKRIIAMCADIARQVGRR